MAYKFIYFDNAFYEISYVNNNSRIVPEIFQRDGEIHVISVPHGFYAVLCFLGDRYLVSFAVNEDDLSVFRQQIDMGVDYKTIMMDLAMKDAYSAITNFKSLDCINSNFLTYLKKEFYND